MAASTLKEVKTPIEEKKEHLNMRADLRLDLLLSAAEENIKLLKNDQSPSRNQKELTFTNLFLTNTTIIEAEHTQAIKLHQNRQEELLENLIFIQQWVVSIIKSIKDYMTTLTTDETKNNNSIPVVAIQALQHLIEREMYICPSFSSCKSKDEVLRQASHIENVVKNIKAHYGDTPNPEKILMPAFINTLNEMTANLHAGYPRDLDTKNVGHSAIRFQYHQEKIQAQHLLDNIRVAMPSQDFMQEFRRLAHQIEDLNFSPPRLSIGALQHTSTITREQYFQSFKNLVKGYQDGRYKVTQLATQVCEFIDNALKEGDLAKNRREALKTIQTFSKVPDFTEDLYKILIDSQYNNQPLERLIKLKECINTYNKGSHYQKSAGNDSVYTAVNRYLIQKGTSSNLDLNHIFSRLRSFLANNSNRSPLEEVYNRITSTFSETKAEDPISTVKALNALLSDFDQKPISEPEQHTLKIVNQIKNDVKDLMVLTNNFAAAQSHAAIVVPADNALKPKPPSTTGLMTSSMMTTTTAATTTTATSSPPTP